MPDATREKLTKIYDAIDTTDSHDRGITIYEFRAATASLNMLYLFGSFEDDEEIWCGDESVRATLDRWLSGMWAYGQDMGEENFEAGLDALVEATGRLHDASTSLPPERLKLLKKVFIAMDMARFGGMTGEVDLALYRPVAATNGNGVANATMIALYAEMERRHLGVFASNTTVDLGQWLGAMAKVSREIDEHQFEADMVAMLNAAPTIAERRPWSTSPGEWSKDVPSTFLITSTPGSTFRSAAASDWRGRWRAVSIIGGARARASSSGRRDTAQLCRRAMAAAGLECPICYELPGAHVHQCAEGHCFCAECDSSIVNRLCPICREPLPAQRIRNLVMEQQIAALPATCNTATWRRRRRRPHENAPPAERRRAGTMAVVTGLVAVQSSRGDLPVRGLLRMLRRCGGPASRCRCSRCARRICGCARAWRRSSRCRCAAARAAAGARGGARGAGDDEGRRQRRRRTCSA